MFEAVNVFTKRTFSEHVVFWSCYFFLKITFLATNTFSDQLLFEDKFFVSTALTSKELLLQNNYSEHVLIRSRHFLLFQKKVFLENSYFFWNASLCNQLRSAYTWKDFPLTMIYSLKYTLSWSISEIPQFFIIENSKQCINFNTWCVKIFRRLVIIVVLQTRFGK